MTNQDLVNYLISRNFLKSNRIIEAFRKIDRKDFVLEKYQADAYNDHPLPINHHQTISQPSVVAFMLEKLNPRKGEKILDLGSGSGWTTALLAELVTSAGEVFGIEKIPELVKFGQKNLAKYNFKNAKIVQAKSGIFGYPEKASYDKILVSAAAKEIPKNLVKQLKLNGKMLIPIKSSVIEITKQKSGKIKKNEYFGFSFVPLVQ